MKLKLPHRFFMYAQNFTIESMLKEISLCAFDLIKNNSDQNMGGIAKWENYSVVVSKKILRGCCLVVQTWLIDMVYDLAIYKCYGHKEITHNETLYLIALYNDYNSKCCKNLFSGTQYNSSDIRLNLYGFLGEQYRFQASNEFLEEFAREKYILDTFPGKDNPKSIYNINVEQDIIDVTGFSSNEFSALVFSILACFFDNTPAVKRDSIYIDLKNPLFSLNNFMKVLDMYSVTLDEIRTSNWKRQVLYTHPIIKIDDIYIASNPFLLLSLFANANYWVLRNLYMHKRRDKQKFVNAFGCFFEMYVEELLNNCINKYIFEKIPEERNEKRADWYLNIDGIEFLVEQKSGLSLLCIKQNQTDIEMLKKHIIKNWGEAVKQLNNTQTARKMDNPIKIILVYEDYYKSECLEELFELDKSLVNDEKYWLVTIREFEMLLMLCHDNMELFKKIINEKYDSEITHSSQGRDLRQFFDRHQIYENKYLYEYNIIDELDAIVKLFE